MVSMSSRIGISRSFMFFSIKKARRRPFVGGIELF
jgi:hypothetical protein